MIYDMRIYTARPGKERAMIDRFTNVVIPIFTRIGIDVVAVYETKGEAPKLIYVTRFDDEAAWTKAWDAFKLDAQWASAKAASETDGPLLKQQDISVMRDIPFHQLMS